MSIWLALRLFTIHTSSVWDYHGCAHEQIGIGTGEDLYFFSYLLLRWTNNARSMVDWRALRIQAHKLLVEDEDEEALARLTTFEDDGVLEVANPKISLQLWDFDEHALKSCRTNLAILAGFPCSGIECQIVNKDVFKLSSYSVGKTVMSTAAAGPAFMLQTLLYCVGGQTDSFIFDETISGANMFELIDDLAKLMGFYGPALTNIKQASRTSRVETAKEGDTLHAQQIKHAFHQPFMVACLEGEYGKKCKAKDPTTRHLMCINIALFQKWLYHYLPPPQRLKPTPTSEPMSLDEEEQIVNQHAMVRNLDVRLII